MSRRYSSKSLYLCTVVIALLVSTTASLSLGDEPNLKIRENEKILTRLEELESKVRYLETALIEQLKERQKPVHDAVQSAVPETVEKQAGLIEKQQGTQKNTILRTCKELYQADPSLDSGMFWIDPDGQGVGDDPIYAMCDRTTGQTSILHDSEEPIDVGHCTDPGCYSKSIQYEAPMRQMDALAELSRECHQSIKYDCYLAPFEVGGVAQAWWNDKNGVAQYFWSGSNNSVHTCQCGIEHNCVEVYNYCNCDSAAPVNLTDDGVITDKKYLPITKLNFGRTQLSTSSGVHTLGRFECTGQVSVTGVPKSCSDLWKLGHTLSGIYSIMGSDYMEAVFCDFSKPSSEQGYQLLIGYADVKSSPVYFYAQKDTFRNVTGRVPFESTSINIGGAMDVSSGIFTAPRDGIYSFAFSGIGYYPTSTTQGVLRMVLVLNSALVGFGLTQTQDDLAYYAISLHSTLELKTGDQVWISITKLAAGAYLYDDTNHFTHFTGHLLQEKVAKSFSL